MRWWWVVDPQTLHGVKMNDAAARDAAAEGWPVVPYNNQDAGLSELGYDPNANAQHQITGDKVLVYNANTARYEWMSRALVDAQNAATQAYGAQTQRAATTADIIAASRGPENAFQYSNALHGQPDAAGVGIFDALAGRLGGATTAGTPAQSDLHPIDIMGRVQAILNRSFGTGGANGSGSSSWADAAGMAPTATEQQAQGAVQAAQQAQQAGQQATAQPVGVSHGAGTAPGPLAASGGTAAYADVQHGAGTVPGPLSASGGQVGSGVAPVAAFDPRTSPLSDFPATYGRTPTLAPDQMGSAAGMGRSGGDKSDIAWKRKYHEAISGAGFGTGSEARARANAAAGMSESQAAHEIKHGRNPYTGIHAAQGMGEVITHPVTIHAGEDGKDEYHIIIPLERADQPVPRALLALANMQSPDRDHMRGAGGVYRSEMVGSNTAGDNQNPLYGVPPNQVDQFGQAGVGPNGVYPPTGRPDDTVNDQSNPIPNYRPGTYDQYQGAPFAPTYSPANDPNTGIHMAAGGGLAVIGGGTTVTPANGPVNAAGQVRVPQGRGTKMVPASRTTPMPDFGALPPALLSLISPSDWQLIGSQYGAAGGNAADIPFLLKRGTQGLGRAPGAFAGKVF